MTPLAPFSAAHGAPLSAVRSTVLPPHMDGGRVLAVLIDNLDGVVCRYAIDGPRTMRFVSEGSRRLFGYAPDELSSDDGVRYESLIHVEDRAPVHREIMLALAAGSRYRVEYRVHCRDGSVKWVLERGMGVRDEAARHVIEAFIEDITAQVEARQRLAEAESRYRSLFENSVIGIFQTMAEGRYLAANGALARMYGYDSPEALIADLQDIDRRLYVLPGRRDEFKRQIAERGYVSDFESEIFRRDGSTLWIAETAHAVYGAYGELLYYQGTVEDISVAKRYREQLEHQANHDPLTGLPNRNLLRDRLQQARAFVEREGGEVAVAFVDLDNFKVINDSLGHATGDELLLVTASRLKGCLRSIDTVARYGGDEFVLILHCARETDTLQRVFDRVQREVARPVQLGGHELQVTCSIGVAMLDGDQGVDELLQNADAAMYAAKSAGRATFAFYEASLNSAAVERLHLESALRHALERGEIEVYFQPKVDASGRACSVEALSRWVGSEFGAVSPATFIPIAEEVGLIEPITEFVLRTACSQAAQWHRAGFGPLAVAVNLSPRLFRSGAFVAQVALALADYGLPAECLELEITEGTLMDKGVDALEQLQGLKALGVRLAVDDFGTGYSSLAYLARFPLDILKIDKAFVSRATEGTREAILSRAVVTLGRDLGMRVVAEGVETEAQRELFASAGCHEFQGYLFARPLSASSADAWLAANTAAVPAAAPIAQSM
ncbi:EAL domain-containing protein [Aromatoleum toluvorans]|uniref:EAL domain-containing protein n=1 Tax=Aromatoleum toluvorans TaxID=92002 RepID=A0ABX1Q1Y6_9RHOO|nr:bifunctional diguanylate cyclase/phosphodiesterase [Aromatoleum toluvorans]NMG44880.1 EAL domain-containing protein [Aromatoleum toluvorans]